VFEINRNFRNDPATCGDPQRAGTGAATNCFIISCATSTSSVSAALASASETITSHDLHLVMAKTDEVLCLNHHICCS
ncbi:hypothetical protein O5560_28425, partial [Escherichia coli]|nr:hypothetical protein [Escherichia coli]